MTAENDRLTERIARLEVECAADQKLVQEMFRGRDQALALQTKEVERRLEDLNHEAQRINTAAAQSVSREVYDADQKAITAALSDIRKWLDTAAGGTTGRRDLVLLVFGAAAFVGAVAGVVQVLNS